MQGMPGGGSVRLPPELRKRCSDLKGVHLCYYGCVGRVQEKGQLYERVAVVTEVQMVILSLDGSVKRVLRLQDVMRVTAARKDPKKHVYLELANGYNLLLQLPQGQEGLLAALRPRVPATCHCGQLDTHPFLKSVKMATLRCPKGMKKVHPIDVVELPRSPPPAVESTLLRDDGTQLALHATPSDISTVSVPASTSHPRSRSLSSTSISGKKKPGRPPPPPTNQAVPVPILRLEVPPPSNADSSVYDRSLLHIPSSPRSRQTSQYDEPDAGLQRGLSAYNGSASMLGMSTSPKHSKSPRCSHNPDLKMEATSRFLSSPTNSAPGLYHMSPSPGQERCEDTDDVPSRETESPPLPPVASPSLPLPTCENSDTETQTQPESSPANDDACSADYDVRQPVDTASLDESVLPETPRLADDDEELQEELEEVAAAVAVESRGHREYCQSEAEQETEEHTEEETTQAEEAHTTDDATVPAVCPHSVEPLAERIFDECRIHDEAEVSVSVQGADWAAAWLRCRITEVLDSRLTIRVHVTEEALDLRILSPTGRTLFENIARRDVRPYRERSDCSRPCLPMCWCQYDAAGETTAPLPVPANTLRTARGSCDAAECDLQSDSEYPLPDEMLLPLP
eukprot:Rhum_TRINITY_DN8052_c0_g1::Rhum_TRINITY_DN8052_c0_g1_i1::g.25995::m.25995